MASAALRRFAAASAAGSPPSRLACRGQVDGGLVFVGFAAVVGRDLVGVALLPARLALGELLVELARVEQDERRELDRACRRVDRAAEAALTSSGMRPQWSRWAWVRSMASRSAGIEGERDAVADRFVRAALEHPAVDQDRGPLGDEQELRAGDGRRATEEVDLHARMVTARGRVRSGRPRILGRHGHRGGRAVIRRAARGLRRRRRGADSRRTGRSGERLDACAREALPSTPASVRPSARGARDAETAGAGERRRAPSRTCARRSRGSTNSNRRPARERPRAAPPTRTRRRRAPGRPLTDATAMPPQSIRFGGETVDRLDRAGSPGHRGGSAAPSGTIRVSGAGLARGRRRRR